MPLPILKLILSAFGHYANLSAFHALGKIYSLKNNSWYKLEKKCSSLYFLKIIAKKKE